MTGAVTEQPQHLAALAKGNDIRLRRAEKRRELKKMPRQESRQILARLVEHPSLLWTTCRLDYMLSMAALTGPATVGRWLRQARVPANKPLGGLTERQRRVLAEAVRS